jgi:cyanophycinase
MSVHLIGGGRDLAVAPVLYGRFVEEARARALSVGRVRPVLGVCIVGPSQEHEAAVGWFQQALGGSEAATVEALTTEPDGALPVGEQAPTGRPVSTLDGLLVGGGLTPAYHRVLQPHAETVRAAVADGLPYAGFSAGAVIAAARALLGGWRLGNTAVTHEDNAEDLDQLTVVEGLGLVPATVEVHTAQWGTLSRLVAAVAGGSTEHGIAIDENTVVILDPATDSRGAVEVRGLGQAWFVDRVGTGARVEPRPPG